MAASLHGAAVTDQANDRNRPQQVERLNRVYLHLDRLEHNMRVLERCVEGRPLWPCVKANAYGHGAVPVARRLLRLGHDRLAVADVAEAAALTESGIDATFMVLAPALPEHAEALVTLGCEPVVCTLEMLRALSGAAHALGRTVPVHVKVDTGMGRIGIRPDGVGEFLEACAGHPGVIVRGIMSHFARADEADKAFSHAQTEVFRGAVEQARAFGIEYAHMANSAAIFDVPEAHFDAARPGVSIYGLAPSATIANPQVQELQPVLEWKTPIAFLNELPAGAGVSYGHAYRTARPSLLAVLPVGYGDGLSRGLSNNLEVLIGGVRCQQVGRITMDTTLVDVTALRGRVDTGDEAVLIGRQGDERITVDDIARRLGTISYEVVTGIQTRVPRIAV